MNDATWPARIELRCEAVTALDLALFAAASGDHNLLHPDADTARAAGFDRQVVHGMLSMAHAARLCTSHFGAGCVSRLQTRFIGIAKLGDVIVLAGSLARLDGPLAVYELMARTQEGTEIMTGTARVARKTPATARPAP